jgi:hypothetical protein
VLALALVAGVAWATLWRDGGDEASRCVGVWEKKMSGTQIRISHAGGDAYTVQLVGGKHTYPAEAEGGRVVMHDVFGNKGVTITFRYDEDSGTLRQGFPDGTEDTLTPVKQ